MTTFSPCQTIALHSAHERLLFSYTHKQNWCNVFVNDISNHVIVLRISGEFKIFKCIVTLYNSYVRSIFVYKHRIEAVQNKFLRHLMYRMGQRGLQMDSTEVGRVHGLTTLDDAESFKIYVSLLGSWMLLQTLLIFDEFLIFMPPLEAWAEEVTYCLQYWIVLDMLRICL